jgi:hypothetical protein
MAVIFIDGFDWYTGGAAGQALTGDALKRWTGSPGGTLTIGPAYARQPSGQGLQCLGASGGVAPANIYRSFGANYTAGVIGFAFLSTAAMTSRGIACLIDGTTEQCSIRTNSSGVLTVNQGATVKATGTTVLSSNVWYYVELKATVHGSTGIAELKLNGATEIASTSSLDLTGTANNYFNGFGLNITTSNTQIQFDDVYLLDTTTGTNTTFLGPVRVATLYPAAPGNYTQWTSNGGSNMGCVNEPYEDGDGSFNQSSTANQIDTFVMDDLPIGSGTVYAVQHVLVARQDAGGPRTIAPLLRIGSTDYAGTSQSLSTSYAFGMQIYDQSPATSSAWSVSEVAGLESGYKILS